MIETLTMNIGLISYAIAGLIYVKLEDGCFEIDYRGCSKLQIAAFQAQMITHYFRIVLTWPLYLIEDFTVYLTNIGMDEEQGDDDDGIV